MKACCGRLNLSHSIVGNKLQYAVDNGCSTHIKYLWCSPSTQNLGWISILELVGSISANTLAIN